MMDEMQIMDWYEDVCQDDSYTDIATLLRMRGLLATKAGKIAAELREAMKAFRRDDVTNDINVHSMTTRITGDIDTTTQKYYSVAKAKGIAVDQHRDSLVRAAAQEGHIEGTKIVLKQINEVLSAMNQHVADLRQQMMRQQ